MRSRLDEIRWTNHTNPERLRLSEAEYDARLARLEVAYDRLETKASGILRVTLTLGGILFGFLLVEGSGLACETRWAFQAAVLLLVASGFLASRAMATRQYVAVGMLPRTDEQVRTLDKWLKSSGDDGDVSYAVARLKSKAEAVIGNTNSKRTKSSYVKWAVRAANAVIPVSLLVWTGLTMMRWHRLPLFERPGIPVVWHLQGTLVHGVILPPRGLFFVFDHVPSGPVWFWFRRVPQHGRGPPKTPTRSWLRRSAFLPLPLSA